MIVKKKLIILFLCVLSIAAVVSYFIVINTAWYHWREFNNFKSDPKTYMKSNDADDVWHHMNELVRLGKMEYCEFYINKTSSSSEIVKSIKEKFPNYVWLQILSSENQITIGSNKYLVKLWAKRNDMRLIRDFLGKITKGIGNWGKETRGLTCRITIDKAQYPIGETIYILVEVKNNTKKPVILGLDRYDEIHTAFGQEDQGRPGFGSSSSRPFPKGIRQGPKAVAKAVTIQAGKTYSEIIIGNPWGPHYGCLPSSAQLGKMTLSVFVFQSLSGVKKRQVITSNKIIFVVEKQINDTWKQYNNLL